MIRLALEIFKLMGSIFVDSSKAEASIHKTDQQAEGFGKRLLGGVGTAAKWAAGVAAAAGAAAVAIGTKATKSAMDFESQMANVATLLDGDVNKRIGELGAAVKKVSKSTGASTELLTDGLYQAISALGDTADSMKILETAAKGAKAGNATVTDSVNLLAAVTKGYGDTSAAAAQKASDLAFNTVKLGQTSFPELAASMGKVIPLASTMKVSQEELFGAMATLTGVTGSTAEVTTQLRGTIQGFMQPSKQMTQAMEKLGYTNGRVMLESLGLQGSLDALKKSVNGDEIAFAGLFGSVEAKNAVLALAGAQAENFTQKTKAMGEAAGMTDKAFTTQTDNTKANLEKLKNSFAVSMTSIGQALLPLANKILSWVADKMPVIEKGITTVLDVVGGAVSWLDDVFTAVTGSISLSWSDVVGFLQACWENTGKPLFDTIQNLWESTGLTFADVFDGIKKTFAFVVDYIKTLWENYWKPVFDFIMHVVNQVAGVFAEHMPAIRETVRDAFDTIKNLWENGLKPAFVAIRGFIENVLRPVFDKVFTYGIKPIIENCFGRIKDLWYNTLKPILTGITDFLGGVFTLNWEKAFNGLKNIVKGVFNGLISVVKSPLNTVISIVNAFIKGLNKLKIPDWVPLVGGGGIHIPLIPKLAKGGTIYGAGATVVGDAGPEILNLPAGARVTPLTRTNAALGDPGIADTLLKILALLTDKLNVLITKTGKVYIDGREAGIILTPYVEVEAAWK